MKRATLALLAVVGTAVSAGSAGAGQRIAIDVSSAADARGAWSLEWNLAAQGRAGAWSPVAEEAAPKGSARVAQKVRRQGDGFEQRLAVEPVGPIGGQPLRLRFEVGGSLRPTLSDDGQQIVFHHPAGGIGAYAIRVAAHDASGAKLPATFEAAGSAIDTVVADALAIHPITIDLVGSIAAWNGSGSANGDYYGVKVSAAGDVNGDGFDELLVTAQSAGGTGRAYLHYGSPTGPSVLPSWTASGEIAGDLFGEIATGIGDVNGDGYSDFAVTAPNFATAAGKVYVYHGSAFGPPAAPSSTATGSGPLYRFGTGLAPAGDYNGDGYGDILVGAPQTPSYGQAYAYLGSPGGVVWSPAATFVGTSGGLGSAMMATDFNGDGTPDLLIGNSAAAQVSVYPSGCGGCSSTLYGEPAGYIFGSALAPAGDVDGDGFADILISDGAYGAADSFVGKVYLYRGGASGLSPTAAWTQTGEFGGDRLGYGLAGAGDVDGDGYADVLIGSFNHGGSGKAYLYNGSATGLSLMADWTHLGNAGDSYGQSTSTAGDTNGDGYSDILIGAPGSASVPGRAELYFGAGEGLVAEPGWVPIGGLSGFSDATDRAGDVNGDGYEDVIIGAVAANSFAGKALLYLGNASGLPSTASWSVDGNAAVAERIGGAVSGAGDVDGDGYEDILIGTPYHDVAYLYYGSSSMPLARSVTLQPLVSFPTERFGAALAGNIDVDGDGYADAVVGAPSWSSNTGRIYVFRGSPAGISLSPTDLIPGIDAGSFFGYSLDSAGDVDGDGYTDLIVGTTSGTGGNFGVYLYRGSPSGLVGPVWSGSLPGSSQFGRVVSGAGDVNGDGYADVLIADPYRNSFAGEVYLYLGSPSGLAASPIWTYAGAGTSQAGNYLDTAGDVNGDGYSDIVISSSTSGTGAWLFLGGPSGPSTTPTLSLSGRSDAVGAFDANGDGFSDLLVGGNDTASLFLGGGGGICLPIRPEQRRLDFSVPIGPGGIATGGAFRLSVLGRSPFGRGGVKLEAQTASVGGSLLPSLNPLQAGCCYTDSGLTGTPLTLLTGVDLGAGLWRMRTHYDPVDSPFQSHGPWYTPADNGRREADLRAVAPCVLPDEPIWIYQETVSVPDGFPILHFQDPNQPNQRTGYRIRRSNALGPPVSAWPILATNVGDGDPGTPNIQWTDSSGDDPAPSSVWYYQVTAYSSNCRSEGPF